MNGSVAVSRDGRRCKQRATDSPDQRIATDISLHDGETRPFVQKKLSLDNANTPLLSDAVAPFARNERKRGFTAAIYYSECYLHGVAPVEADLAAKQAMNLYEKWWIKTSFNHDKHASNKRSRQGTPVTSKHDSPEKIARTDNVNLLTDDETTINSREHRVRRGEKVNSVPIQEVSMSARYTTNEISSCKAGALEALQSSGGDTNNPAFLSALEILSTSYSTRGFDARWTGNASSASHEMDGIWLTLSKHNFVHCEGATKSEEPRYQLGRLAFDMFSPTNLKCSIQAVFNSITVQTDMAGTLLPRLVCPTKLQREILEAQANRPVVRSYDIVTALTLVSGQDIQGNLAGSDSFNPSTQLKRPIKALLTNTGYCIPDPEVPNRLTIWFTGGSLEVQDESADLSEWTRIFDQRYLPNRSLRERARLVASKVMLGAEVQEGISSDGTMRYSLKHPIGGHGRVFVEVLYSDDSFRIVKGHRGSILVFNRVPLSDIQQGMADPGSC